MTDEPTPEDQPKKKRGNKGKGRRKGSKNAKISQHSSGIYRVTTGKHLAISGNPGPTLFYLGNDAKVAQVKRDIIRAEWNRCKAEGNTVWSPSCLERLAGQGIVTQKVAAKAAGGNTANIVKTLIKSAEQKEAELDRYREGDGTVALGTLPKFLTTLFKQELTEPELMEHIRKAVRVHAFSNPIDALRMGMEFYKFCLDAESTKTGVTVNVNNITAYDESKERQTIARIVGEDLEDTGQTAAEDSHQVSDQS